MGNVTPKRAAVTTILQDTRRTLKNATARGPAFQEDAERFLGDALTRADVVEVELHEARDALETARAMLRRANAEANDLVCRIRDARFNDIGRTAHDPRFGQWFPGGAKRYTAVRPTRKAAALAFLATMLETIPHPAIAPDVSATQSAAVRAAGVRVQALHEARLVQEARVRLLGGQRTANARFAAMQLANLKRHWMASGMSQHDVHLLIPNRPAGPARPKAQAVPELRLVGDAHVVRD